MTMPRTTTRRELVSACLAALAVHGDPQGGGIEDPGDVPFTNRAPRP